MATPCPYYAQNVGKNYKPQTVTLSKRHHYIPQFLIKGFTGEDGKVSVYNVEKGKLESVRKSSVQVFFEWNRNTFNVNGEETDFVEGLHQFGENRFAPIYKRIIDQDGPINLEIRDLLHLVTFISVTHWRVPDRDKVAEKYLQHATKEDLFFSIRRKENGEDAPEDIYARIMNEPSFKEASKIFIAIRDYLQTDWVSKIENWNIYYAANNVQLHLLGDNPVILRDNSALNIFTTEMIFPLSKGKTVYHTNGKKVKMLSPEHRLLVDVLTLLQANKMVCGPNGDYLNHIAQYAKLYNDESSIMELKEKVFRVFE